MKGMTTISKIMEVSLSISKRRKSLTEKNLIQEKKKKSLNIRERY
jgi:hypothetical protein